MCVIWDVMGMWYCYLYGIYDIANGTVYISGTGRDGTGRDWNPQCRSEKLRHPIKRMAPTYMYRTESVPACIMQTCASSLAIIVIKQGRYLIRV